MKLSDFPADVQALAVQASTEWPAREITEVIAQAIMSDRAGRLNLSGLTARQADCLRFIAAYQSSHGGISPSHDEIAASLGLASKSGVNRLLEALEYRGRIKRDPNKARAITIITNPT